MSENDTDLSRLLLSNEAADPMEKSAIQARLRILGGRLSALREQVRELEAEERSYRGLISLVRGLPLEVLGEVFIRSVAMDDCSSKDSVVVNLGLVCKRWRDAALLEHRLWSTLRVPVARDRPWLDKNRISSWLCRSGGQARTLHLIASHNHYDDHTTSSVRCRNCAHALAEIITHGPLLHRIALTMHLPECFDRFFTALGTQNRIPSPNSPWDYVDSLSFKMCEGQWGRTSPRFPDLPPITVFKLSLPSMEETFRNKVACEQADLGLSPHFIRNLTRLAISIDWTVNHIVSILQLCTTLEQLTINFQNCGLTYPSVTPISESVLRDGVLLAKVHKLRLKYTHVESLGIFLLLHIPGLRQLEVDFNARGYDSDSLAQLQIEGYWIPFARRHPNLQAIRLSNGTISPEANIRSMFTPFSALTKLTLENMIFNAKALFNDTSTSPAPTDNLFDKLETLELLNLDAAGFAVDLEEVLSFFGAESMFHPSFTGRARPLHANLRRLEITFRRVVRDTDTSDTYMWGNALIAKGVDVCIGPRHRARPAGDD